MHAVVSALPPPPLDMHIQQQQQQVQQMQLQLQQGQQAAGQKGHPLGEHVSSPVSTSAATDSDDTSANGGRKKPGAKRNPFITDMAAHRKEKNRQAQKALRGSLAHPFFPRHAIAERRSQQALETQTELRALRAQVASLGHDRAQLKHENRQMQNILALTFSSWLPEVAKEMANGSSHDAVMIAAKALAELSGPPQHRSSSYESHHHHHSSYMHTPAASAREASTGPSSSGDAMVLSDDQHHNQQQQQPCSPISPATSMEPSPFPSPPARSACLPSSPCSPSRAGSPTPSQPHTALQHHLTSPEQDGETDGSRPPPAAVENCAEMMPCFVLKERILKYGRHLDLGALCSELCHRAVCHGNPWDPSDWTVPSDLFERFPAMR
ncbi:hypothetical protein HKX48_002523 [Thoreauomyces humboldtii]|nr:hypothetical protein HKX48_002523 [Thoreauomyces humboldtii]